MQHHARHYPPGLSTAVVVPEKPSPAAGAAAPRALCTFAGDSLFHRPCRRQPVAVVERGPPRWLPVFSFKLPRSMLPCRCLRPVRLARAKQHQQRQSRWQLCQDVPPKTRWKTFSGSKLLVDATGYDTVTSCAPDNLASWIKNCDGAQGVFRRARRGITRGQSRKAASCI